jgi:hypothetical protein
MIRLTYAPDLVEEAVLTAERTMSTVNRWEFRRERDRLYELTDHDQREERFQSLHLRWFVRLGLHGVVEQIVSERPELAGGVGEGRVVRALTRSEEGADLMDRVTPEHADLRPLLVIRLRPAMLLESEALRALLRHELTHIGDMLDPAFGYERTLRPSDDGPSGDNIVRDRYRVLWDVTIDGRLARAGLGSDRMRTARWQEFTATFSMLGDRRRAAFDDWFDRTRPTHAALAAFAQAATGADSTNSADSGRCPICRFPVASLDRQPERLSADASAAIRGDHPTWSIQQGLCSQCLDLYEARHDKAVDASRR